MLAGLFGGWDSLEVVVLWQKWGPSSLKRSLAQVSLLHVERELEVGVAAAAANKQHPEGVPADLAVRQDSFVVAEVVVVGKQWVLPSWKRRLALGFERGLEAEVAAAAACKQHPEGSLVVLVVRLDPVVSDSFLFFYLFFVLCSAWLLLFVLLK